MIDYLFYYCLGSLLFAFLMLVVQDIGRRRTSWYSIEESIGWALVLILWPLSIIFIILMFSWELYKSRLVTKVIHIVATLRNSKNIEQDLNQLDIATLKRILYVDRIGALRIDDVIKQRVQQQLINKIFEKQLLGDKDVK